MTDNDYVILVDENGTPYIAHGERYQRFKNNLKNSRAVKYLARFPNFYGMGKTAYAYTEQQLRNLRNGGRKAATAVQNTAKKAAKYVDDHDAGLTERIQANRLHRQSLRAGRKGDTNKAAALEREAGRQRIQGRKEYNNSSVKKAADTIEKYGSTSLNAIRGAANKTGHAVKRAGRRVGQFIDDHDMGVTERIQANRMSKRARKLEEDGKTRMAAQLDREAGRIRSQGRQEYENSIVGKAGNAAKNAASSASKAVKNVGKSAATAVTTIQDNAKEIGNRIERASGITARREFDKASNDFTEAIINYNAATQKLAGMRGFELLNIPAVKEANKEYENAKNAMEAAEAKYNRALETFNATPYGAVDQIGTLIDDMFDGIQDVVDGVQDAIADKRRVKNALKTGERSGR